MKLPAGYLIEKVLSLGFAKYFWVVELNGTRIGRYSSRQAAQRVVNQHYRINKCLA